MKKLFAVAMFVAVFGFLGCEIGDEVPVTETTTVVDEGPQCCQGTYESDGVCVPEELPDVVVQPEPDVTEPEPDTKSEYECNTGANCDDGDSCTTETCINGKCEYEPVTCPDGFVCDKTGACVKKPLECANCDDGNACTVDTCDPVMGECQHGIKSCDDNSPKTMDSCDTATGECHHQTDCGPCWDDNACTADTCDIATGECLHTLIKCPQSFVCVAGTCVFQCSLNSECSDNNICTTDSCDVATGKCVNTPHQCDDGDETTVDLCVSQDAAPGWTCEFIATACTGGCWDNTVCTEDFCQNGQCVHVWLACGQGTVCDSMIGQCVPDPSLCYGTADCNDGNPCTTDSCEFGSCLHESTQCGFGEACDAGTGNCVKLEGPDCPPCDDKDPATLDYCADGVCQHEQPVDCGAGTVLNPETGLCEVAVADPNCVDGTISCQQFEVNKILAYALCAAGNWFIVENCGPFDKAVCIQGQGCVAPPK